MTLHLLYGQPALHLAFALRHLRLLGLLLLGVSFRALLQPEEMLLGPPLERELLP